MSDAAAARPPRPYEGLDRQPIAGAWRHGRAGGNPLRDENPWDGSTLVEIPGASQADMEEAYAAAARAQPAWAAALPAERAAVFRKAAEIMAARRTELADWIMREAGGTRAKAELECDLAIAVTLEAASIPHRIEGRILPGDVPGKECRVYRGPVGVVLVISPWNFPLQLTSRSLAPALACGNAVVVKPASDTPVTGGLWLAKVYEEAGLPPGLLSVLVGRGSEIGDALVAHPVPRVVSFTGSTEVGRHIAELAARSPILKRLELELGGNGPLVVLADAELDLAARAAAFGKFMHQGQICMAANRIIVEAKVHDAFLDRFAERVRRLRVGDPEGEIGPLMNRKQRDSVVAKIDAAREAGAREVLGAGQPQGLLVPPHVFAEVKPHMALAREEIFGPVAPVIRVGGAEEALAVANDTAQGLSAAVFTRDVERGVRFARGIQAGMAHVNDQPVNDLPNNPFGGEKNSGLGRFGGDWAIAAFTTDQWVTVQHAPRDYGPF